MKKITYFILAVIILTGCGSAKNGNSVAIDTETAKDSLYAILDKACTNEKVKVCRILRDIKLTPFDPDDPGYEPGEDWEYKKGETISYDEENDSSKGLLIYSEIGDGAVLIPKDAYEVVEETVSHIDGSFYDKYKLVFESDEGTLLEILKLKKNHHTIHSYDSKPEEDWIIIRFGGQYFLQEQFSEYSEGKYVEGDINDIDAKGYALKDIECQDGDGNLSYTYNNDTRTLRLGNYTREVFNLKDIVSLESNTPTKIGSLTAYYAKEDFISDGSEYKKGQLIVDTNDPFNRIVNYDEQHYKYEGDYTGEYYSQLIPKNKVEVKKHTMSELPVSKLGENATFVSKEGGKVRFFIGHNNGNYYYSYNTSSGSLEKDTETTLKNEGRLVLSIDLGNCYFEMPLDVDDGNVRLYVWENCFGGERMIGHLSDIWCNDPGWEDDESSSNYDEKGRLLRNLYEKDGYPSYIEISIAYIASLDALYVNGKLYYRK